MKGGGIDEREIDIGHGSTLNEDSSSDDSSSSDESSSSSDEDEEEEENGHDSDATDDQNHDLNADELGQGWTVYMDKDSGYPYYFNHYTGVSQWHRPVIQTKLQQRKGWNNQIAIQPLGYQQLGHLKSKKPEGAYQDDDADEDEDEDDDEDDSDDPNHIETEEDVENAVSFYVVSSMFHIIVIEAPLAMFEGFFRGIFQICVGFIAFLIAKMNMQSAKATRYGKSVWNGVQLLAGSLTLLIPGALLFAYRDLISAWKDGRLAKSAKVDDWDLDHIPSIIGKIDARNFLSITKGQGANATNVRRTIRDRL